MKYSYTIICTTKQNDMLSVDAKTLAVGNKLIITSVPKYPTKKLNEHIEKQGGGRILIVSPFADRLPDNIIADIDRLDGKIIGYNQDMECKEITDKVTDNTTSIVINRELFKSVNDASGQGDYLFYINQLIENELYEYVIVKKRKAGRLIDVNVRVKKKVENIKKKVENIKKKRESIKYVYKRHAGRLVKTPVNKANKLLVPSNKIRPYKRHVTVFFVLGTKDSHADYMTNPLLDTIKESYTKTVLVSDNTEFESKFDERIPYPPKIKKTKSLTKKDKKQIEEYCSNFYVINEPMYVYPDTSWSDILPKKRIVCVIPIHDRKAITIETVKMLKRQSYPFYKIILVGDTEAEEKIAKEADCHFVKFPNNPLSRKVQAGIDEARKFNPDALVISGSDDWLSYKYNETYIKYINDYDIIGNKEWLVLRVLDDKNIELTKGNYNNNREDPIGAGRTITRGILDKMDWQIFNFEKNSSLDSTSFRQMKNHGKATVKLLTDPDAVLCCIKSTWPCINPYITNNKVSDMHNYHDKFNELFPEADDSLDKLATNYTWEEEKKVKKVLDAPEFVYKRRAGKLVKIPLVKANKFNIPENIHTKKVKKTNTVIKRIAGRLKNVESTYHDFNNETLFFIFTGEWGYEILSSHGWLRKLKETYPGIKIGVVSRAGVEFLYEDACDYYVDISDILKNYTSSMFGVDISNADKSIIKERCEQLVSDVEIEYIYSNIPWFKGGIEYGPKIGNMSTQIRTPSNINNQSWKKLTLKRYAEEKDEIDDEFPGLLESEYIVLQDRRRNVGWGGKSYSEDIWLKVIDKFVKLGIKVVLIGYTPWKKDDSYSIFYKDAFKDIKGTVNISDFLDENIENNILYQAIIVKQALLWIGIMGSASMMPPLLGVDSITLSANRANKTKQVNESEVWNKAFNKCGASMTYLNTTLTEKSIITALESNNLFKMETYEELSKSKMVNISDIDFDINQPLMTFVTRCFRRPKGLYNCIENISRQTNDNYDHIFIVDDTGKGLHRANKSLGENKHRVKGKYVYAIDDDDSLIYTDFVNDVKNIFETHDPDIIIAKINLAGNIHPTSEYWRKYPIRGQISGACTIYKNDIYKKVIDKHGQSRAGDFFMLKHIFDSGYKVYWWDKVILESVTGHRAPEF